MERYVQTFYQYLGEDKLVGQRCDTCGTYRLFPVPVCSDCQGTKLSWTELSPEGKLLLFSVSHMPPQRFAQQVPCGMGLVQLKEGPVFWTRVEGVDLEEPERDLERLPLDVEIEWMDLAGNRIPVCRVR